jgi:hypothetical protein
MASDTSESEASGPHQEKGASQIISFHKAVERNAFDLVKKNYILCKANMGRTHASYDNIKISQKNEP